MHNDAVISLAHLRVTLGLPAEREDEIRDLLAVMRLRGDAVPDQWRLALGDWPELWHAEPLTGPRFLVALRGPDSPYIIVAIEAIDPAGWGADGDADLEQRVVPVCGAARVAARLAGARLVTDLRFGWDRPEERYAFG